MDGPPRRTPGGAEIRCHILHAVHGAPFLNECPPRHGAASSSSPYSPSPPSPPPTPHQSPSRSPVSAPEPQMPGAPLARGAQLNCLAWNMTGHRFRLSRLSFGMPNPWRGLVGLCGLPQHSTCAGGREPRRTPCGLGSHDKRLPFHHLRRHVRQHHHNQPRQQRDLQCHQALEAMEAADKIMFREGRIYLM